VSGVRPLDDVAADLGIAPEHRIAYGRDRAKVDLRALEASGREPGRLILVSAITPTPAGEGKTTCSIGLADGLRRRGQRVALALREPSMGPLFGMKGGATGGGKSLLVPSDTINLLFNGDFPAITAAHNLLSAALDNAIHYRQIGRLDPRRVTFPRVLDMNDRSLRRIVVGLGGRTMGVPRESHFDITAASEVMAILALADSVEDLRQRLGRILVGLTYEGEAVTAEALGVADAMTACLAEAIHPNLVQTAEGTPAFVHCGPFANIAHGTNSILATKMALAHADRVVTEAGFGFDLGAEKFFDIASRVGGFAPQVCVLVATARALKMHGGVKARDLGTPDPEAVRKGLPNLEKHLENITHFGVPVVVALNRFEGDTDEELAVIREFCAGLGVEAEEANGFAEGGAGMEALADAVEAVLPAEPIPLHPLYGLGLEPEEKIERICREIYGAREVVYTAAGKKDLRVAKKLGYGGLAVCMAKTQSSLSDDPKRRGRPTDFPVTIRRVEIAAGAGFLVPLTGDILRMPGLPKKPAYLDIALDADGNVVGLS
jgi:formate--tetrahydrofolate ligase